MLNPLRERGTLDELEHERILLEAVNARDVRMIQRREELGFALEPRQTFAIVRELFRKNFDRDVALELRVTRAVNLTSSRLESPRAAGRSLCSLFAACFRGGATLSRPYSS